MTTIQIEVTAADIAAAETVFTGPDYDGACDCPIARAIRRVYPEAIVTPRQVFLTGVLHTNPFAHLPLAARQFIADFDAGQPVGPITFELEVEE